MGQVSEIHLQDRMKVVCSGIFDLATMLELTLTQVDKSADSTHKTLLTQ